MVYYLVTKVIFLFIHIKIKGDLQHYPSNNVVVQICIATEKYWKTYDKKCYK